MLKSRGCNQSYEDCHLSMDTKDPNAIFAMQQKDIDFMKDAIREVKFSVTSISEKLDIYNNTFSRKEDLSKEVDRLEKMIDLKVDNAVFIPVSESIKWTGRLIIGEIITIIGAGIIALITHFVK